MRTCGACGLPAPASVERCGFCDVDLPLPVPSSLRVSVADGWVVVEVAGDVLCTARRRTLRWTVSDPAGIPLFRLAPYAANDGRRFAVIGDRAQLVGSVQLVDTGSTAAIARDADGEPLATAFTDGPTGIHLVGRDGDVCGLMSVDDADDGRAVDVLVTGSGQRLPAPLILGVIIAIGLGATLAGRR